MGQFVIGHFVIGQFVGKFVIGQLACVTDETKPEFVSTGQFNKPITFKVVV